MFLRRSALAVARRGGAAPVFRPTAVSAAAARPFSSSMTRYEAKKDSHGPASTENYVVKPFEELESDADLFGAGAAPGTIPTDYEHATGLERLEIMGKMQGVDVFDMRPLDASRKGTMQDPITVKSFGDEQYLGCTGSPADSHQVWWLTTSRDRPVERCPECGSVYKMEYVGPQDDGHGHGHDHGHHADGDGQHNYDGEPKTMADFVRPEYR